MRALVRLGGLPATAITIAILVIVYIASAIIVEDGVRMMEVWLGYSTEDVRSHGEYWRLVSSNVIHTAETLPGPRGLLHLMANLVGLTLCGFALERSVGSRYTALVLVIGACGSFLLLPFMPGAIEHEHFGGSSGVVWCVAATGALLAWKGGSIVPAVYLAYVVVWNIGTLLLAGLSEAHLVHLAGALCGAVAFILITTMTALHQDSKQH